MFFGLFLTSVCFLSCSQDDESFASVKGKKACVPASKQMAATTPSYGVDTLIAQIVSDPDINAKVVTIKCDNTTGEIDMMFDRTYDSFYATDACKAKQNKDCKNNQ